MDDQEEIDVWEGEEKVSTTAMPQELWSNHDTSQQPPEPAAEIDQLADQVELQRLLSMGVLLKACDYNKEVTDKLTTKCVYDWRLRDKQVENGETVKCWLRRSRLVAHVSMPSLRNGQTHTAHPHPESSSFGLSTAMTLRSRLNEGALRWRAWM